MSILSFQVHVGKTLGISKLFVQHKIHKLDMVHKMFLYRCAKGFGQIHIFSWILGAKANSIAFCDFSSAKKEKETLAGRHTGPIWQPSVWILQRAGPAERRSRALAGLNLPGRARRSARQSSPVTSS